jgi:pimeloyl-ACP methyl ester carboxylesterase
VPALIPARLVVVALAALALALVRPAAAGAQGPAAVTTLTVAVDDITVAYDVRGQGEPLLLIMGFAGTKEIWDPTFLDELARRFLVVTFDNRAIGGTSAGTRPITVSQLADDTAGLIAALSLGRPTVLGYSMGGMVAQELAVRHPERVGRLIVYGAGCGGDRPAADPAAIGRFSEVLTRPMGTVEQVRLRVFGFLVPPAWLEANRAYLNYVFALPVGGPIPERTVAAQEQAIATWTGACDGLRALSVPALILSGTADQLAPPADAPALAATIPGAWLVRIEGGGHGMMYQFPRRLARIITLFVDDTR